MFEGDFQNGKPHGKGEMTFANGFLFEGDFQNGKPHQGKMILANGNLELVGITPAFNGENQEEDIVFPEPVEARYITFKPKSWYKQPSLRCEVFVDNVLQNNPLAQRKMSSIHDERFKESIMSGSRGWLPKGPYNANEWLKLDLQQVKTITGIRLGTRTNMDNVKGTLYYVSNLALEFEN